MSATERLFDQVVAASRLSRVIAPFTMSRLLISAGVLPDEMTPQDLSRAMPKLEIGLSLYLQGEELERSLSDIGRLGA